MRHHSLIEHGLRQPAGSGQKLALGIKRLMDLIAASLGLILLSPFFSAAVIAIKATSPGPVLYRWPVVGRHGRPLRAYKLRTMVVDADEMKQKLLSMNEARGPIFKMQDDPRVTPIGRILRRFSLDELPQLWNIFKGEMSLIGPRPVLIDEWQQFNEGQRRKLAAKPGGVCLWHVRGQPRDLDEWVKLDVEYIESWSLSLDLKILLAAIGYMAGGKNC